LGISIITGVVVYILIRIVNQEQQEDYYHDKTYWIYDDGISHSKEAQIDERDEDADFAYSQGVEIKGENAYL
jgi:hypothetical protein